MNNLNQLSQSIYQANKEKGFWDQERNVGELLMLVTSELGEAMEAHRKGRMANIGSFMHSQTVLSGAPDESDFKLDFETFIKDGFEDEIADAIIRLFDLCGGLEIDIEFHIREKLKYNATRARLHGKLY